MVGRPGTCRVTPSGPGRPGRGRAYGGEAPRGSVGPGVIPSGIRHVEKMTVNLTRIYTRLGDGGDTHLGDMSRVAKTHPRIEAYGTVDELNAQIGLALAAGELDERTTGWLRRVQNDLFDVGADLAVPPGHD